MNHTHVLLNHHARRESSAVSQRLPSEPLLVPAEAQPPIEVTDNNAAHVTFNQNAVTNAYFRPITRIAYWKALFQFAKGSTGIQSGRSCSGFATSFSFCQKQSQLGYGIWFARNKLW